MNYFGEVHNAVSEYLAMKYGLKREYVPIGNPHNRYDLYSYRTNSYWEIKPISYSTNQDKYASMQKQMKRYDADGAIRGVPLGYDEMMYGRFRVRIYSITPGEIYYTFEMKETEKSQVPVEEPIRQDTTQKSVSIDWGSVGETVLGGVIVIGGIAVTAAGIYQFVTTGDPSMAQQGWQLITQGAG